MNTRWNVFRRVMAWEAMSAVNENNISVPDTTKSQQYLLYAVAGMTLLTGFYLISLLDKARNPAEVAFDLFLGGIVVGLQIYNINRIRSKWEAMTKARQCWIGVTALTVPPIAAIVGGLLSVLALIIWVASFFFRSIRFRSVDSGSIDSRSLDSTAWKPDFGSYWGNERASYPGFRWQTIVGRLR